MTQLPITLTHSFKPYYNWNTFNTKREENKYGLRKGFKPYYNWNTFNTEAGDDAIKGGAFSFKPYYNWNTFNTKICSVVRK